MGTGTWDRVRFLEEASGQIGEGDGCKFCDCGLPNPIESEFRG